MIVVSDTTAITALLKAGEERIASVRRMIAILESRGGLYLSDEVKAEALKLAGE